jgi:hypothetical protein
MMPCKNENIVVSLEPISNTPVTPETLAKWLCGNYFLQEGPETINDGYSRLLRNATEMIKHFDIRERNVR